MPKPPRTSAGILLFRRVPALEVFLVHPGGPLFAKRDHGAWSVPKGEIEPREDLLAAAVRELAEETGVRVEPARALPLGSIQQKGGKVVHAWAVEVAAGRDIEVVSNTFTMEWPPGSGTTARFPEVDRGAFFAPEEARDRVNQAQIPLIDRLEALLQEPSGLP
jgi:predicted NUDIX family NTP pyrophosphohydrolase